MTELLEIYFARDRSPPIVRVPDPFSVLFIYITSLFFFFLSLTQLRAISSRGLFLFPLATIPLRVTSRFSLSFCREHSRLRPARRTRRKCGRTFFVPSCTRFSLVFPALPAPGGSRSFSLSLSARTRHCSLRNFPRSELKLSTSSRALKFVASKGRFSRAQNSLAEITYISLSLYLVDSRDEKRDVDRKRKRILR